MLAELCTLIPTNIVRIIECLVISSITFWWFDRLIVGFFSPKLKLSPSRFWLLLLGSSIDSRGGHLFCSHLCLAVISTPFPATNNRVPWLSREACCRLLPLGCLHKKKSGAARFNFNVFCLQSAWVLGILREFLQSAWVHGNFC